MRSRPSSRRSCMAAQFKPAPRRGSRGLPAAKPWKVIPLLNSVREKSRRFPPSEFDAAPHPKSRRRTGGIEGGLLDREPALDRRQRSRDVLAGGGESGRAE